jgi:microcystin degradation protein MlrC
MAAAQRPRIALLGIHLEANAFAPVSTRADFEETCYLVGEQITAEARREHPAMPMEMASFVRAMDATGPWEPVPVLLMGAEPGGPIEQGFFESTLAEMERRLRAAGPLDGVYVSNHGAMCATGSLDPDGDQFRLVRAVVGPRVPIVVTLDLHANLSQEMVDATDVLIGYRTNPHVDQVERGAEAAATLRELLGGVRAARAFLRLPLVPVQTSLLTAEGPYAELIAHGQARKAPAILNVTVLGGFSYADAPRQGLSVVVTARGDEAAARALAKELAAMAWENRRRFTRTLTSLEDAVALAVRSGRDPALPAHILADVSDNPGGGGRSNTVYLLRALVQAGAQGVLLGNFYDPPLAAEAHMRGVGAEFGARFNREERAQFSEPLELPARVEALAEGAFVGTRGIYAGRTISLGACAALRVGGVSVVVGSHRKQCADPAFFTRLGLDPARARTVVVKSRGHFRAGFDLLFPPERVIEVACPGLTTQDLFGIPYRHIDRARLFPFNADAAWDPPPWVKG